MREMRKPAAFQAHTFIISNLAFQWFDNLPVALKEISQSTKVLAFSTLAQRTFLEWTQCYELLGLPAPTFNYPTIENLRSALPLFESKHWSFERKPMR